ncbi:MAG: hypothetical protein P4M11_12710 [Candidatus Pacebacteria bacterium]|nr:hypothetical protein [Candidatus Paceibacterota bacterium]
MDNYKSLLKKIGTQLEDPGHPFRVLQSHFQDYVADFYGSFAQEDLVLAQRGLVKDSSDVVKVLCFSLIKFYNIRLALSERNADLFLVPVTDLIVRGKVRDVFTRILVSENEKELELLRTQIAAFRKVQLEKLKTSKYFCFDERFRREFKRKAPSARPAPPTREALLHPVANRSEPVLLMKSIEALLKLRETDAPNSKLKQLLRVSKTILKEIDEFWDGYEVKREKLIMDPDSLLSLFIYVIIKAEYAELLIDLKLIETFITEADKSSTKGYYLVTLTIAVDWIKSQSPSNFSIVIRPNLLTREGRH